MGSRQVERGSVRAGPASRPAASAVPLARATVDAAASVNSPARATDLFGQPRGLYTLASTEVWEHISFHGMQALLTLYMAEQLLLPGRIGTIAGFASFRGAIEMVTGPLSTRALASQVFGLYAGLLYLTPVLGGFLGDRMLGRRNAVALGAVVMATGHLCLMFDQSFLVALTLLVVGAGLQRGNLTSQLGRLYAPDDHRRGPAFQLYYAIVNTGGFAALLIAGALGQRYGWHYGFGFAGIGTLAGLAIYVTGRRHLPEERPRVAAAAAVKLRSEERRTVTALLLLLPALTMFWIAQTQIWNVYNLWARDHVNLVVAGWQMPVPWLQSLDGIGAVAFVPVVLWWWRRLADRGKEPDEIGKLGLGCLMFGVAMAWLGSAHFVAADKVPLAWAVSFHLVSAIGYLHVQPVAVALFARAAPKPVNATMTGVYFLSIFAGSTMSGWLGGLYERLSPLGFWLLHAAIVGVGGLLILSFSGQLRRRLIHTSEDEALAV